MAWTWKPAVMESKAPGAICLVQAGGPVGGSLPTVPAAIRAGKRWTLGLRTRSAAEYERCGEWWASLCRFRKIGRAQYAYPRSNSAGVSCRDLRITEDPVKRFAFSRAAGVGRTHLCAFAPNSARARVSCSKIDEIVPEDRQ